MISDEDRDRIVERIQLENEVRRDLQKAEDQVRPSPWAWAESKLGLLIIGAAITGVLVPVFQATQETIKWTRQNRYDNLKYRVESVRAAMKELTLTHAFVAEAFERARLGSSNGVRTEAAEESYKLQVVEMQNRRFRQNAQFVGTLGLLHESVRDSTRSAFNKYLSSVQQLMNVLEMTRRPNATSEPRLDEKNDDDLQRASVSLIQDVDANYEQTLVLLREYLHRLEVQGEKYY